MMSQGLVFSYQCWTQFRPYYANNGDIKPMLVNRQANRCYKCSNLFMNPDEAMLSYKIPLQYGGKNEPHNLVAVCPTCSQFL